MGWITYCFRPFFFESEETLSDVVECNKRHAPTIIEKFPANFSTLQPNIVQLFAVQSILMSGIAIP